MRAQIISFHCVMKNKLGQTLSYTFNQDVINQRDSGHDRLPGLVDGLQSVEAGERRSITVPAQNAYGNYDPALLLKIQRSELEYSHRLMLGSQVFRRVGHSPEKRVFRVTQLDQDTVVMDGNHPLAGQDLVFEIEIVSAREARADDFLDDSLPMSGQLIH
jgi:FKBP-type peptidyl-prolyl cis-trans isomerase SlyD